MIEFKLWRVVILMIISTAIGCSLAEKDGKSDGSNKSASSESANNGSANNKSGDSEKQPGGTESKDQEVTLQILDGKQLDALIASKRGKVVVMDIWSTSCEPCIKEFPHFVAFSKKYPDRVACISLSLDFEGLGKPDDAYTKDPVFGFLKDQQATMDNVLSSVEIDTMLKQLEIVAPPTALVYDTEGKLQKVFDDSNGKGFDYVEIEAYVQGLLSSKKRE